MDTSPLSLRLEHLSLLRTVDQTSTGLSPSKAYRSRTPKERSERMQRELASAQRRREAQNSSRPRFDLEDSPSPTLKPAAYFIDQAKQKRVLLHSHTRPVSAVSSNAVLPTFRSCRMSPSRALKSALGKYSTAIAQEKKDKTETSELSSVIPDWVLQRDGFLSTYSQLISGTGVDIFEVCSHPPSERKEGAVLCLLNWASQLPFFSTIPRSSLREVCAKLRSVLVLAGQTVMQQGDAGDCMYVVCKGKLGVYVGGNRVAELGEGKVVGESALISRTSRTASVKAAVDSHLLKLTKEDHDSVVLGAKKREKAGNVLFLKTIRFFEPWQLVKLQRLSNALISTHFQAGQVVYERNSKSTTLYILQSGQVEVQAVISLHQSNRWPIGTHSWELTKLSKRLIVRLRLCQAGDFFGDLELVKGTLRTTRAVALQEAQCLAINTDEFNTIFTRKEAEALLQYTHLELPDDDTLATQFTESVKKDRRIVLLTQKKALVDALDIRFLSPRDCIADPKARKLKGVKEDLQHREALSQAKGKAHVLKVDKKRVVISSVSVLNRMDRQGAQTAHSHC